MNQAASDRRNQHLETAFSKREIDERMDRLYDEVENAKYTLINNQKNSSTQRSFQSKRVLLISNLLNKVRERINRDDIRDPLV